MDMICNRTKSSFNWKQLYYGLLCVEDINVMNYRK